MPGPAERMARVLALEVALLEAEVGLLDELVRRGIMPADARRTPTVPEIRAGVHFGELERIVDQAAANLFRHTDPVRTHVLDALATALTDVANEPDPWQAFKRLEALTDPTRPDAIPGLNKIVDQAAANIRADLLTTAAAGADQAIAEAQRQGMPDRLIPPIDAAAAPEVTAAADAYAGRVARTPATRLLEVAASAASQAAAANGATGLSVLGAALDAAEQASTAGTEDAARQAANVAHGLGRTHALTALPAPTEVYASELLDRSTCGPCAVVDGHVYVNLEAALVDYPGAGGYIGCEGGARCRGTLVLIHAEATPTLETPGDGRSPGQAPASRTPKPPTNPGRPAFIDPAGNLIPAPRDVGVAPSGSIHLSDLDDTGRTTMPVEDLVKDYGKPVDVAPASTFERDPELAAMHSDDLEALLVDTNADVDRRTAAALELDARDAGDVTRADFVEEQLDPETLASYERDREEWERRGGYAADATYGLGGASSGTVRAGGRAIDRVRQEWAEQLHMDYLAAEDATRGALLRADRAAEFRAKYGTDTSALFEGPARVAYHYASRELRDYWEEHERLSFSEFAIERGITDAKMTKRAQAAARAREDGKRLAEESADRKAAKKRARDLNRRPLTAGERLVLEQKRRDRIRAAERKLRLEAGPIDPHTPPDPLPEVPNA